MINKVTLIAAYVLKNFDVDELINLLMGDPNARHQTRVNTNRKT